jgi:hypothetical protein
MTYNFFELAQDKVETILSNHKIDINFKDDDTFADFVTDLDYHNFGIGEKQYIYTYNCMLQTIAFTPYDVKFTMEVSD